jgi:hypothetical protein
MKNLYLPNYQKILLFCVLLFSSQLTFAQMLADPTGLTPVDGEIVEYDETITLDGSCTTGDLKWYTSATGTTALTDLEFNITETTTYYAACKSSCGCGPSSSNYVPVTIIVNKPFNVTRDQAICGGGSIDLQASCPNGSGSVFWYEADSTTPLVSTTVTPIAETAYNVRCEDSGYESPFTTVTLYVPGSVTPHPDPVPPTEAIQGCTGGNITLIANCTSGSPIFYLTDSVTEISEILTNVTSAATYLVRCEDTSLCPSGFVEVDVEVSTPPTPTGISPDGSAPVCIGSVIALSATCDANSSPHWYQDDEITPLLIPAVTLSSTATYKVRCESTLFIGCYGPFESTTLTPSLTDITSKPASVLACLGDNVPFTVGVTGTPTFQWQKRQADGTYQDILSATDITLTINNTVLADRGFYRCQVIGTCNYFSEEAFLEFAQTVVSKDKLTPSAVAFDSFYGSSVAVLDNYAVVGAIGKSSGRGAAYVFKMNETGGWSQIATLAPTTPLSPDDEFGASVAISNDTIFVGAPGQFFGAGSVYVFKRDTDDTWPEIDVLYASDEEDDHFFGQSVSVSNGKMVIGAYGFDSGAGKIYIFERNSSGDWEEKQGFSPSSLEFGSYFGNSVSISGNTVVAGAEADEEGGVMSGTAYIFEKDVFGVWSQKAMLAPSGLSDDDWFGFSVSVSGNRMVIGAPAQNENQGAAYFFKKNFVGDWVQTDKIIPNDITDFAGYGISVAISGSNAVVGAFADGFFKGTSYVYRLNPAGNWIQKSKLTPAGLKQGDEFGVAVAISQTSVLIGASALPIFPPIGSPFPSFEPGASYFYNLHTYAATTIGEVSQAAGVCSAQKATFNLTGLSGTDAYTITYKIEFTGTPKTVVVTPDAEGNASFKETIVWANNTKNIYITKIKNNASNCEMVVDILGEIAVKAPTQITGNPVAQMVCVGETAVFMVEATGEGNLNFQWQRQAPSSSGFNQPLNNDFSDISVLTLANRTLSDNGALYRAKVTGECGVATSAEAPLTVLPKASVLMLAGPPVCPGTSGTVLLSGTPGAEVHYESNGHAAFTILDGSGAATIMTGPITGATTYNLVSVNVFGKCNRSLSGSVVVNVLPTGTSIPIALSLISPTNDVLDTFVQNHFAQNIQAINKIKTGGKSDQVGNKYVLLEPGFEAELGSVFLAKVGPACP